MIKTPAIYLSAVILALALTACSHMPISTMAKMVTLDETKINPIAGNYAFRLPNNVQMAQGQPVVTISLTATATQPAVSETFIMQKVSAPLSSKHLLSQVKVGRHIDVYKFSQKDQTIANALRPRIRKMQIEKNSQKNGRGKVQMKFALCTTTNVTMHDTVGNVYIQLNPQDDFLTLLQDVNFLEYTNKNSKIKFAKDKSLPSCK